MQPTKKDSGIKYLIALILSVSPLIFSFGIIFILGKGCSNALAAVFYPFTLLFSLIFGLLPQYWVNKNPEYKSLADLTTVLGLLAFMIGCFIFFFLDPFGACTFTTPFII